MATEGGVSLDVVPDARDFWKRLDTQLAAGSKNAGKAVTNALAKAVKDGATQGARDFARELKTKVTAAAKSIPKVKIGVTADTKEVETRLAALEAEVKKLNGTKVKVDVDKKSSDFLGGIAQDASLARVALIGLGPAVVPVLGAVTAAALPLGAALGAAGVSTLGFGLVAKKVLGDTLKSQQKLKQAQDAYNNATTKAGKADALKKQKAILDGLSVSQRKLLVATTQFSSAWDKTEKSLSAPVANGITPWMNATQRAMVLIKPLITPVSTAIHDLGTSVDKYLATKKNINGLKDFAGSVGRLGASTLRTGVTVVYNVLQGVYKLVKDFAPAGAGLGGTVQTLAKRFNEWAGSVGTKSAIQKFLANAKKDGPTVAKAVKNLADAVKNAAKALSAMGPGSLTGFSMLAGLVAKMPPKVIKDIAYGWLAIAGAQRAMATAEKIQAIASGVKALATSTKLASAATKVWAAVQWVLDAAMDANPIGLIVLAIAALVVGLIIAWKHSKTFRDIVTGAFNAIKKVAKKVIDWIVKAWKDFWNGLVRLVKKIGKAIHDAITWVFDKIKSIFKKALKWLTNLWHDEVNGWHVIIKTVGDKIHGAVSTFLDKVKSAFKSAVKIVGDIWGGLKKTVEAPIRFIVDKVINHGILWAWDTVAKWLHLPTNLQIPYLSLPFADGGIVKYYASGGMENHSAQIAPAGAMRVWAEPETGGEAYIPMSSAKRGRSTAILSTVADEFGYQLVPYANGGFWGGIGKFASGVLDKGINFAKSAAQAIADPGKWISAHLVAPVKGLLGKVGNSSFAKAGVAIGEKSLNAVSDAIKKLLGLFSGGGGGGAQAIINAARAELGQGEQPPGSNNTKYGRWFGINPAAWCAMFIDYVANKAGVGKLIPHTASAPGMASAFGNRYHHGGAGIQPGDIPFFSNGGGISHVGLVEKVSGSSVGTIEGNHSSVVQRVARTIGQIVGYGRPNYPAGGGNGGGTVVPGAHGLTFWADDVSQVLSQMGIGSSAVRPVLIRIQHESGGDPTAVNRWDSNWQAGHPSVGLMQVIRDTYNAYAGPYSNTGPKVYGVSEAPKANIYAGVNYARHRYGGNWVNVMTRAGGYDSAGYLPPGYSISYNGTGKPERLFTKHQTELMGKTRGGDGAALIDTVNLTVPQGATAKEVVDELNHSLKVAHHGGKYARG